MAANEQENKAAKPAQGAPPQDPAILNAWSQPAKPQMPPGGGQGGWQSMQQPPQRGPAPGSGPPNAWGRGPPQGMGGPPPNRFSPAAFGPPQSRGPPGADGWGPPQPFMRGPPGGFDGRPDMKGGGGRMGDRPPPGKGGMFDTFDNGPPGPGQFHDRLGGGGRYGDHGPDRRMPPREKGGGGYGGKGGGPSEDRGYGYGYGKGKGGKSQHTGQNFKPSQGATPSREFASAFDFEQSNAKLDMEAVAQEVEKEETLDEKKAPASTYNKVRPATTLYDLEPSFPTICNYLQPWQTSCNFTTLSLPQPLAIQQPVTDLKAISSVHFLDRKQQGCRLFVVLHHLLLASGSSDVQLNPTDSCTGCR